MGHSLVEQHFGQFSIILSKCMWTNPCWKKVNSEFEHKINRYVLNVNIYKQVVQGGFVLPCNINDGFPEVQNAL